MLRVNGFGWAGGLALILAGCDFTPARPPELSVAASPAPRAAAISVEMILDGSGGQAEAIWPGLARLDAGIARVSFRDASLAPGDPPSRQAELIRAAVGRGTSALLVAPADAPEVVGALDEAQAQGIAVLLLDREPPRSHRGKPFTQVAFAPFGPTGKQLVEAARREAERVGLPRDGAALIVSNSRTDRHTADRVAALTDAVKEAGIPLRAILTIAGNTPESAVALRSKLKEDPDIALVLAEEDEGFWLATSTANSLKETRGFIVAGYVVFDARPGALAVSAGVVDRNPDGLVRKALDAAVQLAEGKSVPERVEVPLVFRAGTPPRVLESKLPAPSAPTR